MRKWIVSLAALALVAAPAVAGKYNKVVSVGDKAPAAAAVPAVSADGSKDMQLNMAEIKDDVVVVAFLANHCPAVQACEDRLADLVSSYKGKSVKFVGVCCSNPSMEEEDGLAAVKAKIKASKINMAYAYDADGKIGKAFGATVTPQFFVLDKDRTIRYTGLLDDSGRDESKIAHPYVKTAIDSLLASPAETIEVTETRAMGCGIPYKR